MNKKRILKLIDILRSDSDMEHQLTISGINEFLEEEDIPVADRKTLYDDFRTISEYGYEVDYDKGYYLTEAPFSLSEIKIIIDSLNSLRNLDDCFLEQIKDKLYRFISKWEAESLRKLEYRNVHSDKKFIHRLEDSLEAIRRQQTLLICRKNKEEEEIAPLFLHRENDYYYLYYHYPGNGKIYHVRFDNILSMKLTGKRDDLNISIETIISQISESSDSYYSRKAQTLRIQIVSDSEYLRNRLKDDFPNIIFGKDGFSLKASISDAFFARLAAYGDAIKISDRTIADQYVAYLQKIITRNS